MSYVGVFVAGLALGFTMMGLMAAAGRRDREEERNDLDGRRE